MNLRSNRDVVKSAGIADGTSVDTFMRMQGVQIFLTEEDMNKELFSNDEVLHDKQGMDYICEDADARSFY